MRERIERLHQHRFFGSEEYRKQVKEILMAFADSIAKLQADVNTLIAQGNAGSAAAVAAAVAAKDAADAAAVDAIDATVVAAIVPAAPVAPAAPAAPAA
jgi:hypothetical protein